MLPRTLLLLICVQLGCAGDSAPTCEAAAEHIADCFGDEAAIDLADCDEQMASDILDQGCDGLRSSASDKSDGIGSFVAGLACRAGFLRYCEVPACEAPALDPDSGIDCAQLAEIDGCGGCEYYRCKEAESTQQCGGDGYYLGYGYKYCNRLLQVTYDQLSEAGQRMLDEGRNCLIASAEADIGGEATCGEIRDLGFGAHPDCYAANGFCDLPMSDWITLFISIDTADRDLATVLLLGAECKEERREAILNLFD